MKIRCAGGTHVGMKRSANEDVYCVLPEENLFVVADGMGGHASGEVASRVAAEALSEFITRTSQDVEATWPYKEDDAFDYQWNRLRTGIRLANRQVYETAQSDARLRGMGTTIVGLLFADNVAYLGHVGDSRAYLVDAGTITQITEDHSLLNDYLKVHDMSAEEIDNFPHKNVIVRALGMSEDVEVDVHRFVPEDGQVFLICSDGLSGMVTDEQMLDIVQEAGGDLERTCRDLIAAANARGGLDNISVVLVSFEGKA